MDGNIVGVDDPTFYAGFFKEGTLVAPTDVPAASTVPTLELAACLLQASPPAFSVRVAHGPAVLALTLHIVLSSAVDPVVRLASAARTAPDVYVFVLPAGTTMVHAEAASPGVQGAVTCPAWAERVFSGSSADRGLLLLLHHVTTLAVDTSGLDHMAVQPGETRTFGHQLGPHRASRALAMVFMAMYEAFCGLHGGAPGGNLGLTPVALHAHMLPHAERAAVLRAGYAALTALYPSHAPRLGGQLAPLLAALPAGRAKNVGLALGDAAAAAVAALRAADGSAHAEPVVGVDYISSGAPGEWDKDPISNIPVALGALWPGVTPFVIASAAQFRSAPPPALASAEYMMMFDHVKALGGDGVSTPTVRTDDQTEMGIFWAYDGTPSLCAPPRLYNQVARQVLFQTRLPAARIFRELTVLNVAMADTAIACWETKYHYKLWRPITAIRGANSDGNAGTMAMPTWTPLGAPASNLAGVNFTPPFPAYPSGHATFGAVLARLLRAAVGSDHIDLTFVSDEYNGVTRDHSGQVRPLRPRRYERLSQVEDENGDSRMYLGIHFLCDKTAGVAMGHALADWVNASLYPIS